MYNLFAYIDIKMERHAFGFALVFFVTMVVASVASASVCQILHAANVENRLPPKIDMKAIGADNLRPDQVRGNGSKLADTADYWVTITTGAASWINCRDNKTQKAIYFPIGLILRPIRDIRFASADHTIFQTEYGLNVLVDNKAVAPITREASYIFADDSTIYSVCKPGDSRCDMFLDPKPRAAGSDQWPYFSANKGYLFTKDVELVAAAKADLRALQQMQDDLIAQQVSRGDWPDFDSDAACQPRRAFLYRPFKKFDSSERNNGSEYPRPVRFTLCSRDPGGAFVYRSLKFATIDIAEERFEGLWTVSKASLLDESVLSALKQTFEYTNPIVTEVRCGQPITDDFKTISNLVETPFNEGSVVAFDTELARQQEENAALRKLHIRAYETHAGLSERQEIFDAPLFQDLELKVLCDTDLRVTAADTLRIHAQQFFGPEPFEILLQKLNDAYDQSFGSYGRPDKQVALERLENGQLFRICDLIEYMNWRLLLRKSFMGEPKFSNVASQMGVNDLTLADHMTHLVMATFFFTEARMITNPTREEEKCVS